MRRSRPPAPPPTEEEAEQARAERRARALETPLDVRSRPDLRFVHLEVRNPVHGTRYDVVLPAHPSREGAFCTCTDFARRGIGTCKHLEAAFLWASEHPGEIDLPGPGPSTARLWSEIDRRARPPGRAKLPDPLRVRFPGAALWEEGPGRPGD